MKFQPNQQAIRGKSSYLDAVPKPKWNSNFSKRELIGPYKACLKEMLNYLKPFWLKSVRALKRFVRLLLKPFKKNLLALDTIRTASAKLLVLSCLYSAQADAMLADNGIMTQLESMMSVASVGPADELVVFDPTVDNLPALTSQFSRHVQYLVLKPDEDGISQINRELARLGSVSAVHIIAHGDAGQLNLGNSQLTDNNLSLYKDQLKTLSQRLSGNKDILVYGCNTGEGVKGQQFITQLSALTQADVAASNNITGAASLGGDWNLEIHTGEVETALPFKEKGLAQYDAILHTASVSTLAELNTAITTAVSDGNDDVITLTAEIELAGTELSINVTDGKTLTIVGGGNALDGNWFSRVLNVNGGNVTLQNTTIKNGLLSGNGGDFGNPNGGAGSDALGAGISVTGNATLTLTNSTITANQAAGGGGGSTATGGAFGGGYGGGGGGGFNSVGGGTGGTGNFAAGAAGSAGTGGVGGIAYNGGLTTYSGKGGTTSGGAGGASSGVYGGGGAGGTAGTIGGGGGGGAGNGNGTGGQGGSAVGGIYIATGATLNTEGSTFSSNLGAGGGGSGAATSGGIGGAGGFGVGSVWNKGSFNYNSGNTTFTSNTGTGGSGGEGNTAGAGGSSSAAAYRNDGAVTKNYVGTIIPTITSAIYNASTNVLTVTGTDFEAKSGGLNDVDISLFTFTGEGGATYALTSATDVEITSSTEFSVTLSGADETHVEGLLNKDGGNADTSNTTYNLAAADNFIANITDGDSADTTASITVSSTQVPTISSATYDAGSGALVVTGTNFVNKNGNTNDVDVSTFTFTGDSGATYRLTDINDVEITSSTEFTIVLSSTDKLTVNGLLNKDLTTSDSGSTYNLAAADNWMAGTAASTEISDTTLNGITVSNVTKPVINTATYDASNGVLVVTGTNFFKKSGGANDVDVSLLTFTGESGATYALTSSIDIEITSATSFSVTLSGADKLNVDGLLNENGGSSDVSNTAYNISAADNWMAAAAASTDTADATGNGVTVSNVTTPAIIFGRL